MAALRQSLVDANGQAEALSGRLSEPRERLDHVEGTQRLLDKLSALFELPATLDACLQADALAEAVDYHLRARAALDQHAGSVAALASIAAQCEERMAVVRTRLRARALGRGGRGGVRAAICYVCYVYAGSDMFSFPRFPSFSPSLSLPLAFTIARRRRCL